MDATNDGWVPAPCPSSELIANTPTTESLVRSNAAAIREYTRITAQERPALPLRMKLMEKVVHIFQSLESADDADRRQRQSMTPEQRVEVFLGIQQRGFLNAADERLARVCRVLTLEQG
jgi:hypothetical protein